MPHPPLNFDLQAPDVLLQHRHMDGEENGAGEHHVSLQEHGTMEARELKRLIHHSPSGLAWGFEGSSPADLSINILALHLPVDAQQPRNEQELRAALGFPEGDEDSEAGQVFYAQPEATLDRLHDEEQAGRAALPVELYDGQYVSRLVFRLYQDFKREVLSGLDQDASHVVRAEDVRAWVQAAVEKGQAEAW